MRLFTGGAILTMRREAPRAEAVALDGDRIVAVGDLAAVRAAASGADECDLAGGCLLPGFTDAHHHFSEGAWLTSHVNLHWPAVRSVDEILDALMARAAHVPPGQWIVGEGYDEARLRERRRPTLRELDAACPRHPVLLVQFSYHEAVVNTEAHRVVGLPLRRSAPAGGEIGYDRGGRPTGHLIENAVAPFYTRVMRDAAADPTAAYFDRLARYQTRLFAAGITRVHDAAVSPTMAQTLRSAADRGVLRMPVLMMLSSDDGMFRPPREWLTGRARTGDGADPLRVGPLKLFMDGGVRPGISLSIGDLGRSVACAAGRALARRSLSPFHTLRAAPPMRFDFATRSLRSGVLFYDVDDARSLVDAAVDRGLAVAVHAEGDVAIDRALRVLPPAQGARARGVGPHRIEHFFLPGRDAIARAADRGIAVVTQPTIVEWTGGRVLDMGLSDRRWFTPLRAMLDAGLTVAGSSDAPVVDFDPLRAVRAACRRRTTDGEVLDDGQELGVLEALEMYTIHAARAAGLERETGTLAPGKRADVVVLSADPTAVGADGLDEIVVLRTICGGEDAYVRSASAGRARPLAVG